MKSNEKIEYHFLSNEEVNSAEYIELQNKIHGKNGYESRIKRIRHYSETGDLRILVAKVDGIMVGQASAFKVTAIIEGKEQALYWGCDTFLLQEYRGYGIGKTLQKIMHETCPNFSSAWYSPINGIIKRKCGCSDLMELRFTYYPVSYFMGMMWQLVTLKIFKKRIKINTSIPYLYYKLNKLFYHNPLSKYDIQTVNYDSIGREISEFMETALKGYDFHIKRSLDFLKWAYGWKHNAYTMLKFLANGKIEAIVAFSNIHEATHVVAKVKGVSIYDLIISPDSKLTRKDILMYVIEYHKCRRMKLDGIITFEYMPWFPKFFYPRPYAALLSTYGKKVEKGYLSLIDQDMDQL